MGVTTTLSWVALVLMTWPPWKMSGGEPWYGASKPLTLPVEHLVPVLVGRTRPPMRPIRVGPDEARAEHPASDAVCADAAAATPTRAVPMSAKVAQAPTRPTPRARLVVSCDR